MSSSFVPENKKNITCRFHHLHGYCAAGDVCQYSHDKPAPCRFYSRGVCKFGSGCLLSHQTRVGSTDAVNSGEDEVQSMSESLRSVTLRESLCPRFPPSPADGEAPRTSSPKARSFAELVALNAPKGVASMTAATPSPRHCGNPVPPPASIRVEDMLSKSTELCPFAMVGKCKFGDLCKNVHGIQCPRCLRYCLYPHDLEKNEEHIEGCLGKDNHLTPAEVAQIECGICLARISTKDDPRFGLMTCDHAFCLRCIRTWRAQHSMHDLAIKSCPLCRQITYFVVPSSTWVSDAEEKGKLIAEYKRKCATIHCKYFNHGASVCPFGSSCFYMHKLRDGSTAQPTFRAYLDQDEKIRILRDHRLSDFIDFEIRKANNK